MTYKPKGYYFGQDAYCASCAVEEFSADQIAEDCYPIYSNDEADYMITCEVCGKWLGALTTAGIINLAEEAGRLLLNSLAYFPPETLRAILTYDNEESYRQALSDYLRDHI